MQVEPKTMYLILSAIAVFIAVVFILIKLPEYAAIGRGSGASNEISITIPEGYTIKQIGALFEQKKLFSQNSFLKAAEGEEGYLFPDTYRFYRTASPKDVIAKMKNNFDQKITPALLSEIAVEKTTLKDIIIMASILEEETKNTEDGKLVSGILWQRLQLGMGLQVDAALAYVLGKQSNKFSQDDLKTNSLYNTYLYKGLPPTPISNPGMHAITAAIYPIKSPYLYYLSDKDGKIHYAATFGEHKLNKLKYLK